MPRSLPCLEATEANDVQAEQHVVRDDGKGLPDDFDSEQGHGLGRGTRYSSPADGLGIFLTIQLD